MEIVKVNDTILIPGSLGGSFYKVMKVCKKIIKLRRLESIDEIESEPNKWTTNYITFPLESFSIHKGEGKYIEKNIKVEELKYYKDYINLPSFRFSIRDGDD